MQYQGPTVVRKSGVFAGEGHPVGPKLFQEVLKVFQQNQTKIQLTSTPKTAESSLNSIKKKEFRLQL